MLCSYTSWFLLSGRGSPVEWWLQSGEQTLRAWLPSEVEYGEGNTLIATEFRWVLADD